MFYNHLENVCKTNMYYLREDTERTLNDTFTRPVKDPRFALTASFGGRAKCENTWSQIKI